MKVLLMVCAVLAAFVGSGYQVSLETYVSNAGKQVTVPVMLDSSAGLSYASATITYDPQVLVVTKTAPGSLSSLTEGFNPEFDFVATDMNGTLTVSLYGFAQGAAAGSIASVTFAVREGTAGLYSDLALTDVQLGEKSGVKDVTVGNPLTTQNGMVRVMSASAAVERLENAQTICADTALGSLKLKSGDAIQASDSQTAIVVSGSVTFETAIPVQEPVNGWASGKYALLSTTTAGLSFTLQGVEGVLSAEVVNGITTYYAEVEVAGELPVVCGDETLTPGTRNQIRMNARRAFEGKTDADSLAMKAKFESAKKIEVVGAGAAKGNIAIIADMGIAPAIGEVDETGTLKLTYAQPNLKIISFDVQTGAVRFKVTPGEGNKIVTEIATGYIHVYGTNNLADPMRYISKVGFDLTPYLKNDTQGEGVLSITLGTHTFLMVKIESGVKSEGQTE